ncbi:MAG: NAD-dependent epimerase/dehydratase family protein [Blautia sp.]|nr:NAD-dependent epimerase/dehydratase family protein [Blautia sp.]
MNIILLGAAGFIGTNLTIALAKESENHITVVDYSIDYFSVLKQMNLDNVEIHECAFDADTDYAKLLEGQDIVYHLVSTTKPSTSNLQIPEEIENNVAMTARMMEGCRESNVGRVVFLSSGGTVYGSTAECPMNEETPLYPINSYGLQKVLIEKLLYLYGKQTGIDCRIIRLANPYGPYQRPDGSLGAVTTFTYKALKGEEITVFGDGSVVRDFIYIDDAIRAIINIANGGDKYHVYNVGSGYGTSLRTVLDTISETLGIELKILHLPERNVDVPVNYLDISRYEKEYGRLNPISLKEGIQKTAAFMRRHYLDGE